MKIIDLTHVITPDIPVYPGTRPPSLSCASAYETDGFKETLITMFSHTGTHMDAPAHIFAQGKTLDKLPIDAFAGKALVVNCRSLAPGQDISIERVNAYGEKAKRADFLLFNLGWDKKWGDKSYFGDYPCVDSDVLDFVLGTNKKGIGFDVMGIDPIGDSALPRHRRLFEDKDIVNIENLKNLDKCGDDLFWFFALPLSFVNADGAPVRAVAFWE